MNKTQASKWAEGDFGEGYATYARLGDKWFSVNGINPWVAEIRWQVRRQSVIVALVNFTGGNDDE